MVKPFYKSFHHALAWFILHDESLSGRDYVTIPRNQTTRDGVSATVSLASFSPQREHALLELHATRLLHADPTLPRVFMQEVETPSEVMAKNRKNEFKTSSCETLYTAQESQG